LGDVHRRPARPEPERAFVIRSRSRFRPAAPPDPGILDNHRPLVRDVERRLMLRGGLSLGLLTMLTGCDPESEPQVRSALLAVSSFNDKVQGLLFDPNKLAPTFAASQVLKPPRFNAYYGIGDVQPVNGAAWKLELGGLIADKRPWSTQQIATLPEREIIIRHVCVEGWDYIGQWSGVPLKAFLQRIGADLTAKYVAFRCADNYFGSIDMATALHPQTLLATKYAGEALGDPFGYPLRLRTSTKLGFKNPKWITVLEVTNKYPGGYFENQGFNWFSGM
jgi:DMSO/TMAO reductase YedYZ molybdopterin-dependent catalytic subunit